MSDVLSRFDQHIAVADVMPMTGESRWEWSVTSALSSLPAQRQAFEGEEFIDLHGTLVVRDEGDTEQARIPLHFGRRVRGQATAFIAGSDPSGALRVEVHFTEARKFNLRLRVDAEGMLPERVLPVFRFLAELRPGHTVGLWLDAIGRWAAESVPWTHDPALSTGHLEVIELLDRVQRATGTSFPIPAEFTDEDVQELRRAETLLAGRVLMATWSGATLVLSREGLDQLRRESDEAGIQLEETGTYEVTIAGTDVLLGIVAQRVRQMLLADDEVEPQEDGTIAVRVVAGPDNRVELRLVERAYFDPFDRDLERVEVSAEDLDRIRRGPSLRGHLRSA